MSEPVLDIWGLETSAVASSPASSHVAPQRKRSDLPSDVNKLRKEDRAVHDWYRFALSYPPHFVRQYLRRFGVDASCRVLDPFCGTGTTVVECAKTGIPSVGVEGNPVGHFASRVKTDWSPDSEGLLAHAKGVAELALRSTTDCGGASLVYLTENSGRYLRTLPPEQMHLLLTGSISPRPLHKALALLDAIEDRRDARYYDHERLAFARTAVETASNLHFGPEVGVGQTKADAPVVEAWLAAVQAMASDLRVVHRESSAVAVVHCGDSREAIDVLEPESIDAVITSPPYPNEKDYTRTTRLESVLLGFIESKADLRELKRRLIRSNTRGVYKDDDDDRWACECAEVQRLATEIEARRIELGKTSGFERLYARVTKLYFGGMARHFAELRRVLRPGAHLAYVVGDQASYLRILIRTGTIIAEIAQSLGYELVGIDLFRTRMATATRERLREEVVVLRWPGQR